MYSVHISCSILRHFYKSTLAISIYDMVSIYDMLDLRRNFKSKSLYGLAIEIAYSYTDLAMKCKITPEIPLKIVCLSLGRTVSFRKSK